MSYMGPRVGRDRCPSCNRWIDPNRTGSADDGVFFRCRACGTPTFASLSLILSRADRLVRDAEEELEKLEYSDAARNRAAAAYIQARRMRKWAQQSLSPMPEVQLTDHEIDECRQSAYGEVTA